MNLSVDITYNKDDFIKLVEEHYGYKCTSVPQILLEDTRVTIQCNNHGNFSKKVRNFFDVSKEKCPVCKQQISLSLLKEKSDDNLKVLNTNSETLFLDSDVDCFCQIHGTFKLKAKNILRNGISCRKCIAFNAGSWNSRKITRDDFIEHSNKIHNSYYSYDSIETFDNYYGKKVTIICPVHGKFQQWVSLHYDRGCGCSKCNKRKTTYGTFLKEAKKIHGDLYSYYGEKDFKRTKESGKVKIHCPEHGDFTIEITHHIAPSMKRGCPECGYKNMGKKFKKVLTKENFLEKSRKNFGDKYSYEYVSFPIVGTSQKITPICKQHGLFEVIAGKHYNGTYGCFDCSMAGISKDEKEISEFIENLNINIKRNVRTIIDPYELDIVIESNKLAIEVCGEYWHSEKWKPNDFHSMKFDGASENGYELLTIFLSEWYSHKDIIKSIIKSKLEANETISAHDCDIQLITKDQGLSFQRMTNLKGQVGGDIHIGLFYENKLVSVASLEECNNHWRLLSLSSELDLNVKNSIESLVTWFEKNYNPLSLQVCCDLRWDSGKQYEKAGFVEQLKSPGDFSYIVKDKLVCKDSLKRNDFKLYNNKLTEDENIELNQIRKIFDCGWKIFIKEYDESTK